MATQLPRSEFLNFAASRIVWPRPTTRAVLDLFQSYGAEVAPLSVRFVAQHLGLSYFKARKELAELEAMRIITCAHSSGGRVMSLWALNPDASTWQVRWRGDRDVVLDHLALLAVERLTVDDQNGRIRAVFAGQTARILPIRAKSPGKTARIAEAGSGKSGHSGPQGGAHSPDPRGFPRSNRADRSDPREITREDRADPQANGHPNAAGAPLIGSSLASSLDEEQLEQRYQQLKRAIEARGNGEVYGPNLVEELRQLAAHHDLGLLLAAVAGHDPTAKPPMLARHLQNVVRGLATVTGAGPSLEAELAGLEATVRAWRAAGFDDTPEFAETVAKLERCRAELEDRAGLAPSAGGGVA